jgi:hypothetical protein
VFVDVPKYIKVWNWNSTWRGYRNPWFSQGCKTWIQTSLEWATLLTLLKYCLISNSLYIWPAITMQVPRGRVDTARTHSWPRH